MRIIYDQTIYIQEPLGSSCGPLGYVWYLERQLGPIRKSIAEVAGLEIQLARPADEPLGLF